MAKAAWIVAGGLFVFSLVALVSIGVFLLPVALCLAAILAVIRARGAWLFVVAAGITFALSWLSLIIDPNAPDDSPWPVVLGVLAATAGWLLHRNSAKDALPET